VNVGGTTSEPRVAAMIELRDARYKAQTPLNAKLALNGDLGARKGDLKLDMYSDEELGAKVTANVAIPRKPEALSEALMNARLEADVEAWMPIEQISAIAGDQLAGLGGNLEAHIKARGTLDDPELDADVTAAMKLPEQEGEPVEAARVTAKVGKEDAVLKVWTKDALGELVTLDGAMDWPGGSPRAALQNPAAWKDARFKVSTEVHSRRLDEMQGVFAYFTKLYALSLPIRVAGSVTLEGANAQLGGSSRLALTVYGDKLDGRCRLGAESAVDIDAKLERDHVSVEIGARTDGGGKITGKLSSRLAINALNGGALEYGPAKVTVEGKQIDIHKLPGLCNLEGGVASFEATAEGLGKAPPTLALSAKIDDLRAHEMQPLGVDLKAEMAGKEASLNTQLASNGRNIGAIEARVPLTYPDGLTPTVLPDAKLAGRVRFDKLPLANVLAFTEALGRTSGNASADITISGRVDNPYPVGFVQLEDVNVSIAALAQPLRDIDGRVEIKGRSVKIPKLTVRDRDGKITLEGFANLRDDLSGTAGVYLEADKFPLRQQGTVIGELTTRARLDVKIPQTLKADAQLKILDGSMWLTGERGKSVQTLDPHPDVRFADEKVGKADTEAEQKAAGEGFGLGSFTMKTERELWLNHKDFAIQVGVDLSLSQTEEGPALEGEATLVRGELQLLGKPFKLERGAIRFAGPMPPDPELDIKAKFDPPRGTDLIVQVSGRGSAPVLEFSGAATTAGEALLVLQGRAPGSAGGGQGAESQAANSMAGIAADMTAGLLIMTARREFGDWVPMISVDTGQSGGPASARAGFDASKLIPAWLAGFARSAYVEGIVGQNSQTGRGVGVGVRLEVALPRDFITSFGYGPNPGGWSTDVAWSP
ncbi:MAG: translocation/assembly module TamB domain-containing protein, partial [Polyangiales bacterium]